jgi:hypothetical protein
MWDLAETGLAAGIVQGPRFGESRSQPPAKRPSGPGEGGDYFLVRLPIALETGRISGRRRINNEV